MIIILFYYTKICRWYGYYPFLTYQWVSQKRLVRLPQTLPILQCLNNKFLWKTPRRRNVRSTKKSLINKVTADFVFLFHYWSEFQSKQPHEVVFILVLVLSVPLGKGKIAGTLWTVEQYFYFLSLSCHYIKGLTSTFLHICRWYWICVDFERDIYVWVIFFNKKPPQFFKSYYIH